MLHLTLILADTIIMANWVDVGLWHVQIRDCFSGQVKEVQWTNVELGAVVGLAIGGENGSEQIEALRQIAEPLVNGWPNEVRPIP